MVPLEQITNTARKKEVGCIHRVPFRNSCTVPRRAWLGMSTLLASGWLVIGEFFPREIQSSMSARSKVCPSHAITGSSNSSLGTHHRSLLNYLTFPVKTPTRRCYKYHWVRVLEVCVTGAIVRPWVFLHPIDKSGILENTENSQMTAEEGLRELSRYSIWFVGVYQVIHRVLNVCHLPHIAVPEFIFN